MALKQPSPLESGLTAQAPPQYPTTLSLCMHASDTHRRASLLTAAAQSASCNIILQVTLRASSFLVNAFVLRFISRELLGVVSVRLTLLYSTILFLGREAIRKACLTKLPDPQQPTFQDVVNVLWLSPVVGAVCALLLGYVWMYHLELPDDSEVPHYAFGVVAFAAAAVVELLAEPFWFTSQKLLLMKLKVAIEGAALVLKSLLTVALVYLMPHWGVVCFGIAHVSYAVTCVSSYLLYFAVSIGKMQKKDDDVPVTSLRDILPGFVSGQPYLNQRLVLLSWSFMKQSTLKQLLTEGERYVMTIFSVLNFGEQGVYDLINNLGSFVPRYIFSSIEENAYLFFSQTVVRGAAAKEQTKSASDLAATVLTNLLQLVTMVGLVICIFGHAYSPLALDIYGGPIISSGTGPYLLRWYCLYVLLLAVNGMSECFAFAVMSQTEVDRYNYKMLIFSPLFLGTSLYLASTFGSIGFIWANCLNMVARILHSLAVIKKHHESTQLKPERGLVPGRVFLASLVLAFCITSLSEATFCCDKGLQRRCLHVLIGGSSLLGLLLVVYTTEQSLCSFIISNVFGRKHNVKLS